jgi:hypothetical protein
MGQSGNNSHPADPNGYVTLRPRRWERWGTLGIIPGARGRVLLERLALEPAVLPRRRAAPYAWGCGRTARGDGYSHSARGYPEPAARASLARMATPPLPQQAPAAPPEPQVSAGRVVLYGFKNPVAGGIIERPALVIRHVGEVAQLAVMVDGPLDMVLLSNQERDAVNPRATVWRTAVEKSASGSPEAGKWRWPPR